MPIIGFLLSYLVLPALEDDDAADLAANFEGNRTWFFGLLALLPCVSLAEEALREGILHANADTVFRLVFGALALVAGRIASARFQLCNALAVMLLVCCYVALLFLRLR